MSLKVKCPTCRVEVAWESNRHRPFCSERCRLIDLGAWAEGKYRIPGEELKEDEEDGATKDGEDDEEEPA